MAAQRRTARDQRRRSHGQNFLVDATVVARLLRRASLGPDDLVVELGAGRGALTLPLARTGARVIAVERDQVWAGQLRRRAQEAGLRDRIRIVEGDALRVALPDEPYRVVANVPFGLTTALLSRLLDDPAAGPQRADLLVQEEVARKRAAEPPQTLRSAVWAPWWRFELGERVPRRAFRPVPRVDAAWLAVERRDPPVLPLWLAPRLAEGLRPHWTPPQPRRGARSSPDRP